MRNALLRILRRDPERLDRTDDAGDTLIEVLITMMVVGTAATALVMSFSTTIAATAEHRNLASTDTVLRSVSEKVIAEFQGANSVFTSCAPSSTYDNNPSVQAQLETAAAPFQYTATISSVEYWSGAGFSTTCSAGSTAPQEITVTVNGPQAATGSVQFAVSGTGQIISVSDIQLSAPTVTSAVTSAINVGAITVSFTGSSNAPSGQSYTVTACVASTPSNCVNANKFTSGTDITGLTGGTAYSVTVTAVASPGYLAATSLPATAAASAQTPQPTVTSVAPSPSSSGALTVQFTEPSGAPPGQPFTATACTDSGMTVGCQSVSGFTSGQDITGLNPGTSYYVTVTAVAYGGDFASTSLPWSPPVTATVGLHAPTGVTATASTTTGGVLYVTFTKSDNAPSGQTYTAKACTNSAMTANCTSLNNFASGSPMTGLTPGSTYYATVTANASSGYLAATSAVTPGVALPIALAAPTNVTVKPGAAKKSISVTFTGSANATTYTCNVYSDSGLTVLVATVSCAPSGTTISGLKANATYYVTVTANASPGYLASFPSLAGSGNASS